MIDKIILFPYYLTLKVRHYLYDHGIFKVHKCPKPTICVGNITAGGTGKTPHTEMILKTLLKSKDWGDRNIAVLSRGHKRKSRGFQQVTIDGSAVSFGDEPLQIKKKFPETTVAVDRIRVEGCEFLCNPELLHSDKRGRFCKDKEMSPADLIILDDAFQYRSLKATFNIVLIDFNHPTYQDHLLPLGRLRDLPERLRVADMIIVTKCPSYLNAWEKQKWAKYIGMREYNPDTCLGSAKKGNKQTLLFSTVNYCPLKPVYDDADARYTYSKKVILFSGIAKDKPLRKYLSGTYKLVRSFKFSDHHKYTSLDIRAILKAIKKYPTAVVATTEKDAQRIVDNKKVPAELRERLFQVPIKVDFLSQTEKEIFENTLLSSLKDYN